MTTNEESEAPPLAYVATFGRRFTAMVVDDAIVAAVGAVFLIVDIATETIPHSGRVLLALMLAFALLHEPLLVARRGSTFGQAHANLHVITESGGRPGFFRAWARAFLKHTFGLISFISIVTTRRHWAIHDVLTGTSVRVRDPSIASPWHYYPNVAEWSRHRPRESASDGSSPDGTDENAATPVQVADVEAALAKLDAQMAALRRLGWASGSAVDAYNRQRAAILRGELTAADLDT